MFRTVRKIIRQNKDKSEPFIKNHQLSEHQFTKAMIFAFRENGQ